ncbi:NAD-dependent epimerase/dehydratase family protein [Bacillus sp. EB01]|uniref:NAD-dependent epimerase/dehydratase family protein n=1 Tax=Bacillus sp. EB01 TaxID=1347086 RepID=UPI0005C6C05C|nr:NAD-dependent epimerase/dehydratase family protein [Bacillus sp. EB01]
MKKILITGKNSYVGNSFIKWLQNYPGKYSIDTISLRKDTWKEKDFSIYDAILHVAGIAHVSSDPKLEELYYKVNRDLTIEIARKAKAEGIKQFIFMSSIIVYGDSGNENRVINLNTRPSPSNFYGNSKLQAEKGLESLVSTEFRIVIVRPPMIYGKGSKGNFPKLSKIARVTPVFPDIENRRSMIHVDNLSEFLRLMIEYEESGTFFPQNLEYVKTSEMVKIISEHHGKKLRVTKLLNPFLKLVWDKTKLYNKVFGNLVYDQEMSKYKVNYRVWDFATTIYKTEK